MISQQNSRKLWYRVDRLYQILVNYLDLWLWPVVWTAAWLYYPYCETGPTLCLWKLFFHVRCPTCGLTRGLCFLLHGKIPEALRFNAVTPVVLLLMVACFAQDLLKLRAAVTRRSKDRETCGYPQAS